MQEDVHLKDARTPTNQKRVTWRERDLKCCEQRRLHEEDNCLLILEEEDLHNHRDYQLVGHLSHKTLEDLRIHSVQEKMEEVTVETHGLPPRKPHHPQGDPPSDNGGYIDVEDLVNKLSASTLCEEHS